MSSKLHADEITITRDLVRTLVDTQFPRFAGLSLVPLAATGSTNMLYRLGDDLLVRLPRQPGGSDAIDKEMQWLPVMARHLPVTVPEILGVGEPAFGFPERWSITRWIDGTPASAYPPTAAPEPEPDGTGLAQDLAEMILALRRIPIPNHATSDPALRWYRGGPLTAFDDQMHKNIETCRAIEDLDLDLNAVERVWTDALAAPEASHAEPDQWFHSDLVAENLLTQNERLTGVLDFGGLAIGDPTIDLHGAWEVFGPRTREVFRIRLNVDDKTWMRGRAWALAIAVSVLSYYWTTMPMRCADRLAMARNVLADAEADH